VRLFKSLYAFLLASVAIIYSFANSAHAEGIYSKADAAQMFEMSVSDWNANVMAVQTQGIGQALGNPTDGFGMAIQTPDGYLIVRPNYRTPAKPEFLSVTIGFPPAQAQYLTEEMLQEVVGLSIKQLEPEFVMTAEIEKVEGGIAIMAIIREHDPY
jgi:hypothetical protein